MVCNNSGEIWAPDRMGALAFSDLRGRERTDARTRVARKLMRIVRSRLFKVDESPDYTETSPPAECPAATLAHVAAHIESKRRYVAVPCRQNVRKRILASWFGPDRHSIDENADI